ncbi:DUF3950 domain-containing protein [Salmonella enterica subsp. enterica]|nr:hypothetical protein [Salmonella enterica subsp. enterica]ECF5952572.1 DUF3950 domain-containing protein [Salmonella enterica subsp. salamae]EEI9680358.1 DUF3950 domain-containing protein [Salmonella enterica]EAW2502283.1 DUF3950 domain-containing protein [Salmonella enterica subsp. enterica]ECJ5866907.1 DUF3950 domain-containing protein [Salmonella enterica subsp. salamae]
MHIEKVELVCCLVKIKHRLRIANSVTTPGACFFALYRCGTFRRIHRRGFCGELNHARLTATAGPVHDKQSLIYNIAPEANPKANFSAWVIDACEQKIEAEKSSKK